MLSKKEKKELKDLASSLKLKEDLRKVLKNRHNPFIKNGEVDADCLLDFLAEYNNFINHTTRPFHKIEDGLNKL